MMQKLRNVGKSIYLGKTKLEKENYGVFVYRTEDDENIDSFYTSSLRKAKKMADKIKKAREYHGDFYIEVWKKDKEGLFGNFGRALYRLEVL